jgi:hypothetical protein
MLAVTRTFAVKSTPRYLLMCEEHGALTFTLMTFIQVYFYCTETAVLVNLESNQSCLLKVTESN